MGLIARNDACPDCGGASAPLDELEDPSATLTRFWDNQQRLPLCDKGFLLLVGEAYPCLRYTRIEGDELAGIQHEWRCANSGKQTFLVRGDGENAGGRYAQGHYVPLLELAAMWLASAPGEVA
ncbi:hypothetical protein ACFFQW_47845 [Umezawaea endophytica]|uniref:Uncharacterized protein n=1 Tax=Umezawaea endophytica TaxID=1654476 RepID=A0A9X3ALQ1_9PSEU|nr:hypothetical protein [Umezawaea endophytica]MCS7484830.1 hypothetical protein [Umezawaea endophytica]